MSAQSDALSPSQILEGLWLLDSKSACYLANQMVVRASQKEISARTEADNAWELAFIGFVSAYGFRVCSWCNLIIIEDTSHLDCDYESRMEEEEPQELIDDEDDGLAATADKGTARWAGDNHGIAQEARQLYPGDFI
ncbi:MAG TPA: hypothetical protein VFT16_05255 [Candidatus Saccharimonadales bacterium]|nr:hypothetical protein [Candidatus Saccharimonadales bacterium]